MSAFVGRYRRVRFSLYAVLVLLVALTALVYRSAPSFAADKSDPDTCTMSGEGGAVCTEDGGGGWSGGGDSGGQSDGSGQSGSETGDQGQGDDQGGSDQGDSDQGDSDQGDSDQGDSDQGDSDQGDSDQGDSDQGDSNQIPPTDVPPSDPPTVPPSDPPSDPPTAPPTVPPSNEYGQCLQQSQDWQTQCNDRGNTICSIAGGVFGGELTPVIGPVAGAGAGGGLYGICDARYGAICRQGYADDVAECNSQQACRAAGGGSTCFDRWDRFRKSGSPIDPWP